MCPHDKFDILYYEQGIIVRQCKDCKEIEVDTEWWFNAKKMFGILNNILGGVEDK